MAKKQKAPQTIIQNCTFTGSPTSELIATVAEIARACAANARALEEASKSLAGPQAPLLQINGSPKGET